VNDSVVLGGTANKPDVLPRVEKGGRSAGEVDAQTPPFAGNGN
jgi:hypothetical protein